MLMNELNETTIAPLRPLRRLSKRTLALRLLKRALTLKLR
jgi:hypothetical protein